MKKRNQFFFIIFFCTPIRLLSETWYPIALVDTIQPNLSQFDSIEKKTAEMIHHGMLLSQFDSLEKHPNGIIQNPTGSLLALVRLQLTVRPKDDMVLLSWNHDDSIKVETFEIQKYQKNSTFAKVGSAQPYETTFLDSIPFKGVSHYKIILHYAQGEPDTSETVAFTLQENRTFEMFPNPATDKLTIRYAEKEVISESGMISIVDMYGRVQYAQPIENAFSNVFELELNTERFANGIYECLLQMGYWTKRAKIIIQR
jgi:hypothetical protein